MLSIFVLFLNLFLACILCTFFNTASSDASKILLCRRTLGWNSGLWRHWHWQSAALSTRLDLILNLLPGFHPHFWLALIHQIETARQSRLYLKLIINECHLSSLKNSTYPTQLKGKVDVRWPALSLLGLRYSNQFPASTSTGITFSHQQG